MSKNHCISFPEEMIEKISRIAVERDRKISWMVRYYIDLGMKHEGVTAVAPEKPRGTRSVSRGIIQTVRPAPGLKPMS